MMWNSASKEEVLAAIEEDWKGIDRSNRNLLSALLIDPIPSLISRFGKNELAYIVARIDDLVVFYDDIEDIFGVAKEEGDCLIEAASYGSLPIALSELDRRSSKRE